MLPNKIPTLSLLVAAISLFTLTLLHSNNFALDPGAGWHLATGRWIAEMGSIPRIDPFLALPSHFESRPWISDQWLSDLFFFKIFQLGSWNALHTVVTIIFFLTFFGILLSSLKFQTGQAVASVLATLLAFKLAQVHFLFRPVIFSILFFAVVWATCRSVSIQKTRLLPLWLVPLFALWANLHPSFVLGNVWLFITTALSFQKSNKDTFYWNGLIASAALCATVVNPYGVDLHRSILALSSSDYFMNFHVEWKSPDFKTAEGEMLLFTLVLIFLGLLFKGDGSPRPKLFDLVSFSIFLILTLRSIRTLPFLGIVSTPLLIYSFSNIGDELKRVGLCRDYLVAAWKKIETREYSQSVFLPCAVLILIFIVAKHSSTLFAENFTPRRAGYPAALVEMLVKSETNSVVYAEPALGGYITFRGWPKVRAVIDDRNTLLGEGFYKEFFRSQNSIGGFKSFLENTNATHIVAAEGSQPYLLTKEVLRYQEIYSEERTHLFKISE